MTFTTNVLTETDLLAYGIHFPAQDVAYLIQHMRRTEFEAMMAEIPSKTKRRLALGLTIRVLALKFPRGDIAAAASSALAQKPSKPSKLKYPKKPRVNRRRGCRREPESGNPKPPARELFLDPQESTTFQQPRLNLRFDNWRDSLLPKYPDQGLNVVTRRAPETGTLPARPRLPC